MIDILLKNAGPVGAMLGRLPKATRLSTARALNETAKEVQAFALNRALPGAFTLRKRGQPWQKPGSRFGFNVRPWAKPDRLETTIGSQADWLKLQERGGVKQVSGRNVAVEAGARPTRNAVLPSARKPRRLLAKSKGGFFIRTGPDTSLLLVREGKETRLQYVIKPRTNIKARLNYEQRGSALAGAVFPAKFSAAFARNVSIGLNDALNRL